MGEYILSSLSNTLQRFEHMALEFLPRLIAMLIIIALGWIVALILRIVLRYLLRLFKFNRLCESAGLTQMLAKAALPPPDELLSRLVFWVIGITFLFLGFNALDIPALQELISRFFQILPQIFVAMLVFFVGLLAANFFSRAALLAAVNADYPSPRLLSRLVRFLIIILAGTMALDQVGLGHRVVEIAFSIAFGAVMLAVALAFGLGGRDAARRAIERQLVERKGREEDDEVSHL